MPDPTSTAEQVSPEAPEGAGEEPRPTRAPETAAEAPAPAPQEPAESTAAGATQVSGDTYGAYYYSHDCGIPYERSAHWNTFFGRIADHIIRELHPASVLDAGCAIGLLVEQLRDRGVDAYGVDISDYAHGQMPEDVRAHCKVASLTEPLDRRYDLITCIEVVEHMPPADGAEAIANLCSAADRILLSSSPYDYSEPTHLNVQPPEHWSALMAQNGFVRDFGHDASYLTPWATLYVKADPTVPNLVRDYDRSWWRLRHEAQELRAKVLEMQANLESGTTGTPSGQLQAENDHLKAEQISLSEEILRLRDVVMGKEAEMAVVLGRVAELTALVQRYENLEGRLDDVLSSKSWKLMWAAGTPVRLYRQRKGE